MKRFKNDKDFTRQPLLKEELRFNKEMNIKREIVLESEYLKKESEV